jgi:hypothetical protein
MEICTLSFNRPDFLEPQWKSIQKYAPGATFTVFDNAPDDSIKDECRRLGLERIPIKIFGGDPSFVVGVSLNKMWGELMTRDGILVYIDSDMFLTDVLPDMSDHDFAFVPQKRPPDITYPWTGLMLFNMDTLPAPHALRWNVDYNLKGTDVGGLNHFYLKEHNPKVLELEMFTLTRNGYSHNGVDCEVRPYHKEMEKIALSRPFDVFTENGRPFVLHYKSASNYPDFYTPEYNQKKTDELMKLL